MSLKALSIKEPSAFSMCVLLTPQKPVEIIIYYQEVAVFSQRSIPVIRRGGISKDTIIDAQSRKLRAIMEEMNSNPGESLTSVMQRRPPWVGWIDEDGRVRNSPRYLGGDEKGISQERGTLWLATGRRPSIIYQVNLLVFTAGAL